MQHSDSVPDGSRRSFTLSHLHLRIFLVRGKNYAFHSFYLFLLSRSPWVQIGVVYFFLFALIIACFSSQAIFSGFLQLPQQPGNLSGHSLVQGLSLQLLYHAFGNGFVMEHLLPDFAEKETGTLLISVCNGEPTGFVVDKIHGALRYLPPKEIHAIGVLHILEGVEVDLLTYLDDNFSHVDLTPKYPNRGVARPIHGPVFPL
jgi:hypothetical protein